MAWATPKTDWSAVDSVTATDMNRIEENISVLNSDKLAKDGGTMTGDLVLASPLANRAGRNILIGTSTPGSGDGSNGDVYIKY